MNMIMNCASILKVYNDRGKTKDILCIHVCVVHFDNLSTVYIYFGILLLVRHHKLTDRCQIYLSM